LLDSSLPAATSAASSNSATSLERSRSRSSAVVVIGYGVSVTNVIERADGRTRIEFVERVGEVFS